LTDILRFLEDVARHYVPSKLTATLCYKIFERLYRLIQDADINNSNRLLILKRHLIFVAENEIHYEILRKWLDGTEPVLKGHSMRFLDKWNIVQALYASERLTAEEKKGYFDKVWKEDPSDSGINARNFCETLTARGEERD